MIAACGHDGTRRLGDIVLKLWKLAAVAGIPAGLAFGQAQPSTAPAGPSNPGIHRPAASPESPKPLPAASRPAQDDEKLRPARSTSQPADAASKPAAKSVAAATSRPFGERLIRITAEGVNLRSRPDKNSTVIAKVDSGDVLKADGEQFGWLAVVPPDGVFSFVSAEHIEPNGDKGRVKISSGTLRVRVGSTVATLDPGNSDVQTRLQNGATVTIIERAGDWYKIKPPPDVRLWVATEFTLPAGALGAARMPVVSDNTRSTVPPTTQPAHTRPHP